MSVDYWEPWTPEIGQRVRTKISPECPQQMKCHGRHPEGSGHTGTVRCIDTNRTDGHIYCIATPEVAPDGYEWLAYTNFAAAELEPVE